MDITSIETFLTVAQKQSFSLAAEYMHLTQPAISKRIASLESELNCKLFDRINKRILLTKAGQIFLPRAQQIIKELKNTKNNLAEMNSNVSGELVMATSHHIGLHHLPPVLKHFVNQFPKVDLKLDFMESETACLAVENAEIELAVITLPNNPDQRLKCLKVWSDPLKITLHNHHPLIDASNKKSGKYYVNAENLKKITKFPAILPEKGTYTREIVDEYLSQCHINVQEKLSNNFLETIKMMVSVGLGWSVLPQTMIDNTLTQVEVEDISVARTLGIVSHRDRTLSPAAQKMIELIINLPDNTGESPTFAY